MRWCVRNTGIKGKPLCILQDGALLYYSKSRLHTLNNGKTDLFCNLPSPYPISIFSKLRIIERILRTEPRVAVVDNKGRIHISHAGRILTIDNVSKKIISQHPYRKGMQNPLNVVKISEVEGFDNCVAYGDYWGNPDFDPVAIYAKNSDLIEEGAWKKVYEFPSELNVTHIHNIVPDSKRGCVYILTGDTDTGSGIWEARNNFQEVIPLLTGKQMYRSCVAIPVDNGLIYATDTPLEENGLYFVSFDNPVLSPELISTLPGSVIYGCSFNGSLIFSTTVEPNPKYQGMRYLLTQHLGPGIKDRYVHLLIWNKKTGLMELKKIKKDVLPMGLCQFGAIMFSPEKNEVYAYPVGVSNYDGGMFKVTEER